MIDSVPLKQPWWILVNKSHGSTGVTDITTTKQSTAQLPGRRISVSRCLTSIGIPIIKIRWSWDHLIFIIRIPISKNMAYMDSHRYKIVSWQSYLYNGNHYTCKDFFQYWSRCCILHGHSVYWHSPICSNLTVTQPHPPQLLCALWSISLELRAVSDTPSYDVRAWGHLPPLTTSMANTHSHFI